MSQHVWYEHFKEQLQGLTESFEQSHSSLSLLGYALEKNLLSSDHYFAWATSHYKLPKLQSRFFSETPLSQEMFAKWATHYRWSAECLPVAEWDGSLIVACLEPPQDFPEYPGCAFVLVELSSLQSAWKTFNPEKTANEAPEGISLVSLATENPPKTRGDNFSFDDLAASTGHTQSSIEVLVEGETSPPPTEGIDGLDGLLDMPTIVRLEGLPAATPVAETEEVLAFDQTLNPVEDKAEVEEEAPANAAPEVPPLPEDSFSHQPIPVITPRPAGHARPTINPVAVGHFALEKLKKKHSTLIAEKVKVALSQMKSHFTKAMILTLDEEETQLMAFAWDENFKEMKDTSRRFPLKTPSIFNIVASTQKPFHGYISINEINETFFEEWNKGVIPDHVTLTPIVLKEKIVGILMGFADKSAYNKSSLILAEQLSAEFTKGLAA